MHVHIGFMYSNIIWFEHLKKNATSTRLLPDQSSRLFDEALRIN